jgi:hypothetical protein
MKVALSPCQKYNFDEIGHMIPKMSQHLKWILHPNRL